MLTKIKTTTRILIIATVVIGLFGQNSFADKEKKIHKTRTIIYEELDSNEMTLPDIVQEDVENPTEGIASLRASAPGLTYLEVFAVGSSQFGGYERIEPSQFSTIFDHGGNTLIAVTLELGYGFVQVAKMNGMQLSSSANYRSDAVCWNSQGNLVYCSSGQTVAGWVRYWDISGFQNGSFTYQNTSFNPTIILDDAIFIQ